MATSAKHVAFIMDGNGRWAKKRFLPRLMGHRAGAKTAKTILRASPDLGVEVVTLFAFGSDNWKRPASEVKHLMSLFLSKLRANIDELHQEQVRVKVIGDISALDPRLQNEIRLAEQKTAQNRRLHLNIAMNYSGSWDMTQAVQAIVTRVVDGELDVDDIDSAVISAHTATAGLPDPDLMIRTSGEERLSDFMIWQCRYSEFHFTDTLWPDFTVQEYRRILQDFQQRERRFGKTSKQVETEHA